jgi:hypothetical protein
MARRPVGSSLACLRGFPLRAPVRTLHSSVSSPRRIAVNVRASSTIATRTSIHALPVTAQASTETFTLKIEVAKAVYDAAWAEVKQPRKTTEDTATNRAVIEPQYNDLAE